MHHWGLDVQRSAGILEWLLNRSVGRITTDVSHDLLQGSKTGIRS
jgi:hypothetical protein